MPKQYKVTPGFLVEMPRMEKPDKQPYEFPAGSVEMSVCFSQWKRYNAHIAILQKIPIAQNVSFEGEIINEDQFEVREAKVFRSKSGKIGCAECCNGDCDCEVGERCTYRGNRRGCTFCKGECWYESAEQIPKYAYPIKPKQPEGKEKGEDYCEFETWLRGVTSVGQGTTLSDIYKYWQENIKSSSPQPQPTQEDQEAFIADIYGEALVTSYEEFEKRIKESYYIKKNK